MATHTALRERVLPHGRPLRGDPRDPTYQAYVVLRFGFVFAPIVFGVDKFFNWMTYWPKYLWVGFPNSSCRASLPMSSPGGSEGSSPIS